MPGPVTVRNLATIPLTLQLIERYEAPSPENFPPNAGFSAVDQKVDKLASNFTGLLRNVTGDGKSKTPPTHAQLGYHAKSFKKDDINVQLEPLSTQKIKAIKVGDKEITRLTFIGEGGGKWRIDVPTYSGHAEKLISLGTDSSKNLAGIYFASSSFLTIFDQPNPQRWMKRHADTTPLSALSVPGTHNSPTHHKALPSVRCQAVSPKEQLEHGVRFFDIRVQVNDPNDVKSDELTLVHSVFPVALSGSKKFRPLYEEILDFLKQNPSETVIISLKREGPGDATDAQLASRLKRHYVNDKNWFTEPGIPTLGQARGKIVLMRRFGLNDQLKQELGGKGWGINGSSWADNTPNSHGGNVQVQDFYEVLETENIEKKTKFVCEHCERAAAASTVLTSGSVAAKESNAGPIFVNFLSASNFWKPGCWPEKIAAKINPAVTRFLCEEHDAKLEGGKGDGGTGILVCDWVGEDGDWDLVKVVIGLNARVFLKEKGADGRVAQSKGVQEEDNDDDNEDDGSGELGTKRGGRGGHRQRGGRGRGRGHGD